MLLPCLLLIRRRIQVPIYLVDQNASNTCVLSVTGLPQEVDHYNELVPLEPYCLGRAVKSSSYGLITSTYKATHTKTGLRYCLKRIHGI